MEKKEENSIKIGSDYKSIERHGKNGNIFDGTYRKEEVGGEPVAA